MRNLTLDRNGIEGLPLKLLITAVVMGISIPAVLAAWSNVEKVQTENSLRSEINYLILRIRQVHRAGPGNSVTVDVNLDSGMFTSIEHVLVGDGLQSQWRSTIRWKLGGESEQVIPIDDGIPVVGNDGKAFRLTEGHSSLYLEVKKEESGLVFVEISVQD
ncbi:MAG: hypothetical protein KAW09_00730 [Thermoplasmata archaeon]|nr:hypothetical protein [Thermoplasmata archaeon]